MSHETMDADEIAAYLPLVNAGFNPWVACALACRGKTLDDVKLMSLDGIMDEVLSWYGILGYTGSILAAVANVRAYLGSERIEA